MARTLRRVAAAVALSVLLSPAAQAWELGNSGLQVERTPQSLLVTGIDPHSPADGARLPAMGDRVLRLRYVNGKDALELLEKDHLRVMFGMPSVTITLGVRGPGDLEERLEGPYRLDLVDAPETRIKRFMATGQWEKGSNLVRSGVLGPSETEAFWSRLALAAHEHARGGQWREALAITALLGPQDPVYARLQPEARTWRAAMAESLLEDRRLSAREVIHQAPNPRLAAKQPAIAKKPSNKTKRRVARALRRKR